MKETAPLLGKKILVVGLGVSGRATAEFLLKKGAHVWGVDQNSNLILHNTAVTHLCLKGLKAVHDDDTLDVAQFEFVVVSPGVPPHHKHVQAALKANIEVVGEIELAARFLKNRCIGITGTNGKNTVTLLVTHILNNSGIKASALGNVGTPLISELEKADPSEVLVIELSSYQLETVKEKFLDAAVILNVTPDHLDRYASMDDYAQAKINITAALKDLGVLFVEDKTYLHYGKLFKVKPKLYGYTSNCDIYTELEKVFFNEKFEFILPPEYRGKISHDVENLLAAYAMCREFGVSGEDFVNALSSFKKPPHRIEFVTNIDGVKYYDDSKGTNIDAVIRAVNGFEENLILIAGGVDKGAAYNPWIDTFKGKVKCVCAIGQAAKKIKNDLSPAVPVELFASLDAAVKHAAALAKPGDTVLLSPGCSSFDMFKDYAHRGDEFKKIVNLLKGG